MPRLSRWGGKGPDLVKRRASQLRWRSLKVNRLKRRAWTKAWQKANPVRVEKIKRRASKKAHLKDPTRKTASRRLQLYGLSAVKFEEMLVAQRGLCAICHCPETRIVNEKLSGLAVDHDHESGFVRGLLCYRCNSGLGSFKDNPLVLESAIRYLQESRCPKTVA